MKSYNYVYSVKEVSKKFKIKENTVKKYIYSGRINAKKCGNVMLIKDSTFKPIDKRIERKLILLVSNSQSIIQNNYIEYNITQEQIKIIYDYLYDKGYIKNEVKGKHKKFIDKIPLTKEAKSLIKNIKVNDILGTLANIAQIISTVFLLIK